jgi:hypothetical protein
MHAPMTIEDSLERKQKEKESRFHALQSYDAPKRASCLSCLTRSSLMTFYRTCQQRIKWTMGLC